MNLLEFWEHLANECISIHLYDTKGTKLGVYDGRNSIDKKYNHCVISHVENFGPDDVGVYLVETYF